MAAEARGWAALARVNARLLEIDQAERAPVTRVRLVPANDSAPEFTAAARERIEALLVSTGFG